MKTLLTLSGLFFYLVYFSFFNEKFPSTFHEIGVTQDTVYVYKSVCENEIGKIGTKDSLTEDTLFKIVTSLALPVSSEKLMAYYPFEYNNADTSETLDMSGFDNIGITNGIFLEEDTTVCENHYYRFVGQRGYIKIGKNIKPYGNITVSMWVLVAEGTENDTMVLFNNDMACFNQPVRGIELLITSEKKLRALFRDGKHGGQCSHKRILTQNSVFTPGRWYHISVTFSLHTRAKEGIDFPEGCSVLDCRPNYCIPCEEGEKPENCIFSDTCACHPNLRDCLVIQDTIQIYIDGIKQPLGDWEGCGSILAYSSKNESNKDGIIGFRSQYCTQETDDFKGKLDDILVFNRVLTEEEIQRLAVPKCEVLKDTIILCTGECYEGNCESGIYPHKCEEINLQTHLTILAPLESTLDTTICLGEYIEVNGTRYSSAVNTTEVFTNIGKYNCDSTVFINLQIEDCNQLPPTGFTPNNDSFNDCFIIPSLQVRPSNYPNNELIVYNSNGQIVYRTSPYQNDWYGNDMDGKELPIGSYGYVYMAGNGEKPIKAIVSINR